MSSAAEQLRVGGLQPLTTIDYPGSLAAVVFCQGCPWRCRYCQNPDLIPTRGEVNIPWPDILSFLERRRGLLDAVVFSGGEPTVQAALHGALEQTRALGFLTGLHSAGPAPKRLRTLLPHLDWIGLDIKAAEHTYPELTGVSGSGSAAWHSARLIIDSGIDHEIRITAHPAMLRADSMEQIVSRLDAMGARRIVLQPLRSSVTLDPELSSLMPADLSIYHQSIQRHSCCSARGGPADGVPAATAAMD